MCQASKCIRPDRWAGFAAFCAIYVTFSLQAQSPTEGISRQLAQARATQISDVHYRLSLELAPDADQLPGRVEISFQLADAQDAVVLDFRDGSISHLAVNGASAESQTVNGHLVVPARFFSVGRNRIALDFVSGIATSGRAITRYPTATTAPRYIYSLFVPMDASQAFPCFDQPDLKARFDLDITVPDNWTTVSNTTIESVAPAKPGFRHTDFAETQPLPTYLVRLRRRAVSRHSWRGFPPLRAPV